MPRKEYEEQVTIKALKEISREIGNDNPHWGDFLGPRKRAELLRRYEDSNRSVAIQYLGREGGRLFFQPWPNPDERWKSYPGLSKEKAAEISSRLRQKLNSMPYRWDCFRFAVGGWLHQHSLLWLLIPLRPFYRLLYRLLFR